MRTKLFSKKMTALLLAAALSAGLLAGCGASAGGSAASSAAASAAASASDSKAASTSDSKAASVSDSTSASASDSAAASTASSASSSKPTRDRSGNAIKVPDSVSSIISLSPAESQTLVDLGMADKIVACDSYSSSNISGMPSGIPTFDMVNPDIEKITALAPDIIFTSGISYTDGSDVFATVRAAGICVADVPSATSYSGIQDDIRFIASCVGAGSKGEELCSSMQKSTDEITKIAATIKDKKKVLYEVYTSPTIYSCGKGTYIDDMITMLGAENAVGSQSGWVTVTDEAAITANPDVILTSDENVTDPVSGILSKAGWENVTAIKDQSAFYITPAFALQPTAETVKALQMMAVSVYPDEYGDIAKEIVGNDDDD